MPNLLTMEKITISLKNSNRKKETSQAVHSISNCLGDLSTGNSWSYPLLCLEQELSHCWKWWTKRNGTVPFPAAETIFFFCRNSFGFTGL